MDSNNYLLSLTAEESEIVLLGLGELQAKISHNVINKIVDQTNNQDKIEDEAYGDYQRKLSGIKEARKNGLDPA